MSLQRHLKKSRAIESVQLFLDPTEKHLLEQAAKRRGQEVSAYTQARALECAKAELCEPVESTSINMNEADWIDFISNTEDPAPPTDSLCELMDSYRTKYGCWPWES